jgi:predicted alpha/beta-fold hydrolase
VSTSVSEYYYNSSSIFLIDKIKIPTLVIHAKDDPIIPVSSLPLDSCLNNQNFIVILTNYGSHC